MVLLGLLIYIAVKSPVIFTAISLSIGGQLGAGFLVGFILLAVLILLIGTWSFLNSIQKENDKKKYLSDLILTYTDPNVQAIEEKEALKARLLQDNDRLLTEIISSQVDEIASKKLAVSPPDLPINLVWDVYDSLEQKVQDEQSRSRPHQVEGSAGNLFTNKQLHKRWLKNHPIFDSKLTLVQRKAISILGPTIGVPFGRSIHQMLIIGPIALRMIGVARLLKML